MSTVTTASFAWNELLTPDVAAAKSFYCELLGWTAREEPMGPGGVYHMFECGGRDVGGMVATSGTQWQGLPGQWLPYLSVDDVDAVAARVPNLGGTVSVAPTTEPGVGRFCVVTDPTGAAVALITFERR